MLSADVLLALVALVTALGAQVALVIHALRVPYRESAAQEQIAATDSMIRVRDQRTRSTDTPPPPPPPPAIFKHS